MKFRLMIFEMAIKMLTVMEMIYRYGDDGIGDGYGDCVGDSKEPCYGDGEGGNGVGGW